MIVKKAVAEVPILDTDGVRAKQAVNTRFDINATGAEFLFTHANIGPAILDHPPFPEGDVAKAQCAAPFDRRR